MIKNSRNMVFVCNMFFSNYPETEQVLFWKCLLLIAGNKAKKQISKNNHYKKTKHSKFP